MKDNSRFGTVLYIHYLGGIAGETPIDDRREGEPVKIVLGAGQVVPGIEDALCDMHEGDEATVTIGPEEAYGRYQEEAVQVYPRIMLPDGANLKVGDFISWTNPASGQAIPVRIIETFGDSVKVDFNHPFAGQAITYWLKVEREVA